MWLRHIIGPGCTMMLIGMLVAGSSQLHHLQMAALVSVLVSKVEADQWLLMAEALLQRLDMKGGAQLVVNVELTSCTIFATSREVWVKTLRSAWLAWLFLCLLAFVVAKSSAIVAATRLVRVYPKQLVFVRMNAVLVAAW